jgi:hypothetical protein
LTPESPPPADAGDSATSNQRFRSPGPSAAPATGRCTGNRLLCWPWMARRGRACPHAVVSLIVFVLLFGIIGTYFWFKGPNAAGTGNGSAAAGSRPGASSSRTGTDGKYTFIAVKDIPVSGLQVGATFYGALAAPVNGHYVVSNLRQGGTKDDGAYDGYDDNGVGACGGKYNNLANQATWAEDGMGKILGRIPCGTKLLLTYNGHNVVAEKGDISGGGCSGTVAQCAVGGHERAVDMWWQTAKALCLSRQPAVITIHVVPQRTPATIIPAYHRKNPASTAVCH